MAGYLGRGRGRRYLFGPWRDDYTVTRWVEDSTRTDGGYQVAVQLGRDGCRRELDWQEQFRDGLCCALSLSQWDAAVRIAAYPAGDVLGHDRVGSAYDRLLGRLITGDFVGWDEDEDVVRKERRRASDCCWQPWLKSARPGPPAWRPRSGNVFATTHGPISRNPVSITKWPFPRLFFTMQGGGQAYRSNSGIGKIIYSHSIDRRSAIASQDPTCRWKEPTLNQSLWCALGRADSSR